MDIKRIIYFFIIRNKFLCLWGIYP